MINRPSWWFNCPPPSPITARKSLISDVYSQGLLLYRINPRGRPGAAVVQCCTHYWQPGGRPAGTAHRHQTVRTSTRQNNCWLIICDELGSPAGTCLASQQRRRRQVQSWDCRINPVFIQRADRNQNRTLSHQRFRTRLKAECVRPGYLQCKVHPRHCWSHEWDLRSALDILSSPLLSYLRSQYEGLQN